MCTFPIGIIHSLNQYSYVVTSNDYREKLEAAKLIITYLDIGFLGHIATHNTHINSTMWKTAHSGYRSTPPRLHIYQFSVYKLQLDLLSLIKLL